MDVNLALGGGGAKGHAHIGVLRVLEREGVQVRALAGTSIGGLIGAVYLAGYSPDQIEARFNELDQSNLFGRLPEEGPAVLGLGHVAELLREYVGDRTFEDLPVPFAVSAVDLVTGREHVLRTGPVLDAVLATIALPGLFPPRQIGGHRFVDGGLINPVPVDVARALAPGYPVVAVVLNPSPHQIETLPESFPFSRHSVLERLTRFRLAQAFRIFVRSIDITSKLLTDLRLQVDKPEVIVRPDMVGIGTLDDVDVSEMVKRGERAAEAKLDEIKRVTGWWGRLQRRLGVEGWLSRSERHEP